MRTRIEKRGHGLGVRIPKSMATKAGLKPGMDVEFRVYEGEIRVRVVCAQTLSLTSLLAGVTTRNRHDAIESANVGGREHW